MAEELTDEQKKARRAEINRQNAQKSTGPKSEIGKMNVRLNGLKHGARSKIIDMSLHESLVLLPTEGPTAYKKLLANYADKLQPRDEVEVGLVQRIGDLQWRLLRNTKNERVFNEDCLAQAAQLAHPGATEDQICNLDGVNAFRIGSETKLLKEFRREEAAIGRLINASLRELNMLRNLDPLPKQPLTRNAQILGPSQASTQFDEPPTEEIIKIEPVEKKGNYHSGRRPKPSPHRLGSPSKRGPVAGPGGSHAASGSDDLRGRRFTRFLANFGPKSQCSAAWYARSVPNLSPPAIHCFLVISLFITCYNDALFPQTGQAVVTVLERLGHTVEFRAAQTCCGQMHYNTGYRHDSYTLLRQFLEVFADAEVIVCPSSSCVAMIRDHYPKMAEQLNDPALQARVAAILPRIFEFSELLTDKLGLTDVGAFYPHSVTLHASCHGLRSLHLGSKPADLLKQVKGLTLIELPDADQCCGFGGTFAVKNPDVSAAMLSDKLQCVLGTNAEACAGADNSCLMHIGGALSRQRTGVRTVHLAEILASTEKSS